MFYEDENPIPFAEEGEDEIEDETEEEEAELE